jgi:hypothetical protein
LAPIEIVKERINRKIATERVFVGFAEHVVASNQKIIVVDVVVDWVAAERGNLDHFASTEKNVGEAEAPTNDAAVAKNLAHVFGPCVRCDVEVFWATVEEQIANTTTNEVGLKAGALEPLNDFGRVWIDGAVIERSFVAPKARTHMALKNRQLMRRLLLDRE